MAAAPASPASRSAPASARALFGRPPGLVFHGLLALPTLALLYAYSFPGGMFFLLILVAWVFLAFVLVWLIRGLTYLLALRRGSAAGTMRWFALAPLGGVIVVALIWAEAPLRLRWAESKGAFEDAVATAPPATSPDESIPFVADARIGSYRIDEAIRVGDGVLFFESTGAFLNYAGFAYLPQGPFEELEHRFEAPRFRSLGSGWYAFTASW